MKKITIEKAVLALLVLVACSTATPWFNIAEGVTSPDWGIEMLLPIGIGTGILAWFICEKKNKRSFFSVLLAELAFVPIFGSYAYYFIHFQYLRLIADFDTFDFAFSMNSTLPWFWLSVGISAAAFLAFQMYLIKIARQKL